MMRCLPGSALRPIVPGFLLVTPLLAQSPEPAGALPYDLAFDRRELLWSTSLAITADGRRVAWEARRPPTGLPPAERYLPNGTPAASAGAKVYVADLTTNRTVEVCSGGNCWRPSWSPDGKRLAFYSDAGGQPELWVHDVEAGRARKLVAQPIKAKLWIGDQAQWSPSGDMLYVPLAPSGVYRVSVLQPAPKPASDSAAVTVLRSGREAAVASRDSAPASPLMAHFLRENLAQVAAVDARTGKLTVLVPSEATPKPSVMRVSPSGRWISYLSVFKEQAVTSQASAMDLAVVPASGGPVRLIAADVPTLEGEYHRLNYNWHPTDDRLVYFKDKRIWLVEMAAAGPSQPRVLAESLGDIAPTVYLFTRDGRALVVGTDPKDDRGYGDARPHGIALVPLDGSAPTRFAIDDSIGIYRDVLKADDRTIWQPDGQSVTLLLDAPASGGKAVVRFDPRDGSSTVLWKGVARLDRLTGGGSHDAIFGVYEELRTPPDIYRFAPDFSARERISHIEPRLEGLNLGSVELFETIVPFHDGSLGAVRTAVLLPPGAKRGDKLPAVVLMYPGSDVSRAAEELGGGSQLSIPTMLLTSRGFAVVLANLTLGPNREAGNPAQEMTDVLLPQVYRAAELGYIDISRVGIGGQSFGGFGTAAIISRTNLFRAAVAVSGIYDLPGTYGHHDKSGGSFWIGWNEGGQARMGTHPWANLRRYLDNSPYYQADKIFTPLLIVHGTDDLAYHDGQKLFTALRRLERPAQFASYAGQGHVISEWTRPNAIDAARRIVDFYRTHLSQPHPIP
ncbi:MAG TPA: prolyl oligopeptidase family serine peptidase [Gemmatimonadales bacterium]